MTVLKSECQLRRLGGGGYVHHRGARHQARRSGSRRPDQILTMGKSTTASSFTRERPKDLGRLKSSGKLHGVISPHFYSATLDLFQFIELLKAWRLASFMLKLSKERYPTRHVQAAVRVDFEPTSQIQCAGIAIYRHISLFARGV